MKTNIPAIRPLVLTLLALTSFVATVLAQEVPIPDPGLNAAIRAALQKPFGPLTEQDLLSLTNLDAGRRNVKSIDGLEAARNLISLDLQINRLTNFSLPGELTKLITLDASINPLTSFALPPGLAGMTELNLSQNLLTSITLPVGMTNLIELNLFFNQLTNLTLPADLRNLIELDLDFNQFSSINFPSNLNRLGFL